MFLVLVFGVVISFTSCNEDEPQKEDVPELITQARLTFTPSGGGAPVVVTATDPDGEGVQDIEVDGSINLSSGVTYTLTIDLINGLAEPGSEGYDIGKEVEEEGDEHMFFFAWTGNVFADPVGNGNIDNRADAVNYDDEDANGFPIGLMTRWTAGTTSSGTLRVVLKHQPDLKTATSSVDVGETDLDITFDVSVN